MLDLKKTENAERIRDWVDSHARSCVEESFGELLHELNECAKDRQGDVKLTITVPIGIEGTKVTVASKAVVQRTLNYTHNMESSTVDLSQMSMDFAEDGTGELE